jgi:uncharacterized membrane protein
VGYDAGPAQGKRSDSMQVGVAALLACCKLQELVNAHQLHQAVACSVILYAVCVQPVSISSSRTTVQQQRPHNQISLQLGLQQCMTSHATLLTE